MTTLIIPIPLGTTQPFNEQVEIEQKNYDLTFYYNDRDGKWRCTIALAGDVLVRGLVLVNGLDLLRNLRHVEGLPPGTLFVHDLDGLDTDPSDTNFGDRVLLAYTEA